MERIVSTADRFVINLERVGTDHTIIPGVQAKAVSSIWSASYFSLLICFGLSAVLVVFYLLVIRSYVFLPADLLMWAETNFVGDIIKLRTGIPLYTPPEDSNSMIYTPGATLLTYGISWLIGKPTSIVAWRIIQLCFVACAALIASASTRMLRSLAYHEYKDEFPRTWFAFTFMALFVIATSPLTNRFTHALHADALALLVSVFSFWTVLLYLKAPSWKTILLMALCPALGFMTKQFLISWAAVMFIFLLLHSPRNIRRLALFAGVSSLLVASAIGVCYLLWGDAFIFWVFEVTGGSRKNIGFTAGEFNISLLRSLDHIFRAWMEIAIGLVGGWLILREDRNIRTLGPLWIAWIVLIGSEALSSGSGWNVLYHFGPGVVIGAVWLFAALPRFWPSLTVRSGIGLPTFVHWARCLIAIAAVLTVFLAVRVVPTGAGPERRSLGALKTSPDLYRYIADIEREFNGLPADKVLLDVGNWIYLRQSVLMKDRAISLADQPPGGIYRNMDVMVSRIRSRTYSKILVRNLNSPLFLYDWSTWDKPSGVRQALLENYVEMRTIPQPEGNALFLRQVTQTGPISVLVPRQDSQNSNTQR
jgi:hypothetical protein